MFTSLFNSTTAVKCRAVALFLLHISLPFPQCDLFKLETKIHVPIRKKTRWKKREENEYGNENGNERGNKNKKENENEIARDPSSRFSTVANPPFLGNIFPLKITKTSNPILYHQIDPEYEFHFFNLHDGLKILFFQFIRIITKYCILNSYCLSKSLSLTSNFLSLPTRYDTHS